MKELFGRLKTFDLSVIFQENTDDLFVQMFRYVFVGGIAFLVDLGTIIFFYEILHVNVYLATAIAFVVGLIVNFILSKLLVFQNPSDRTNAWGEFIVYGIIGVIGLVLTELNMWIFLKIGILYVIAKIVAAILVLLWNFAARKYLLYN